MTVLMVPGLTFKPAAILRMDVLGYFQLVSIINETLFLLLAETATAHLFLTVIPSPCLLTLQTIYKEHNIDFKVDVNVEVWKKTHTFWCTSLFEDIFHDIHIK